MMPAPDVRLRFPGHAPLLADHFPGAPRVPGSCLLEAMRRTVEGACAPLRVTGVRRARFRRFVLPETDLVCRMEKAGGDGTTDVRCRLWHEGDCLAEAVFVMG